MAVPGKFDLNMEETDNYYLDLLGIQETQCPVNGKLNSKHHALYYRGCDNAIQD